MAGKNAAGVVETSGGARGGEQHRLAVLDSYRAIAIFCVLSYHYTERWAPPHDPGQHLPAGRIFAGTVLQYGWIGVEFFFVISGFVILMTLERCNSAADFFIRRFARLWPAMLVAASLTTLSIALIGPADWQVTKLDYLTSIFFIDPSISSLILNHPVRWVDGAYWSLWEEVRFYLLAGAVYWIFLRNLVAVWIPILVTLPLSILYYQHTDFVLRLPSLCVLLIKLATYFVVPLLSPNYFPFFTLGVCAYEIWSNGKWRGLAYSGIVIAEATIVYSIVRQQNVFADANVAIMLGANVSMLLLFALFVIDHPSIKPFRFAPLVLVGQASYSLYLIHQNIGVGLLRLSTDLGLPYLVALPLVTVAIIGAAILMFRFLEIPAKSWILRRGHKLLIAIESFAPGLNYKSKPAHGVPAADDAGRIYGGHGHAAVAASANPAPAPGISRR